MLKAWSLSVMWAGSRRRYVPDFLVRLAGGTILALEIKGTDSPCLINFAGSRSRREPLPATPFMAGSGGGWIEEAWVFRTVSE